MAPPVGVQTTGTALDPALLFKGRWWQHKHILTLNILLLVPLVTSYANGFGALTVLFLRCWADWSRREYDERTAVCAAVERLLWSPRLQGARSVQRDPVHWVSTSEF
jgi:hypothetical protein